MKAVIVKYFLPWTAASLFDTEEQFHDWLRRRCKWFTDVRIIFLLLAVVCLLIGYFLDRRPIMLLTIAPLALVLLLTMGIGKMEAVLGEPEES